MNKILLAVLALSPLVALSNEPTKLECSVRYEVRTREGALRWTAPEAQSSSEIRFGGAVARGTLTSGETYLAELNLAIDEHHPHEYNTEFYMHVKKDGRKVSYSVVLSTDRASPGDEDATHREIPGRLGLLNVTNDVERPVEVDGQHR
jgi:hypothetical protein